MKTFVRLQTKGILLFCLIFAVSCSDDDDTIKTADLIGTSWKSTDKASGWEWLDYSILKFVTNDNVELWVKGVDDQIDYRFVTWGYQITDNLIEIFPQSDYATATIDGNSLRVNIWKTTLVYTRQ